jgi:hypothetical protein
VGSVPPVADWVTISALATAGGTLALAATTYASVRSGNRSARTAERTLLAGLRPLLVQSSPDDPPQRVRFIDEVHVTAAGGSAGVEVLDGKVYLVVSLRNVGPGIGVLHGGYVHPEPQRASIRGARSARSLPPADPRHLHPVGEDRLLAVGVPQRGRR